MILFYHNKNKNNKIYALQHLTSIRVCISLILKLILLSNIGICYLFYFNHNPNKINERRSTYFWLSRTLEFVDYISKKNVKCGFVRNHLFSLLRASEDA